MQPLEKFGGIETGGNECAVRNLSDCLVCTGKCSFTKQFLIHVDR